MFRPSTKQLPCLYYTAFFTGLSGLPSRRQHLHRGALEMGRALLRPVQSQLWLQLLQQEYCTPCHVYLDCKTW
jgi:hypothetical protein